MALLRESLKDFLEGVTTHEDQHVENHSPSSEHIDRHPSGPDMEEELDHEDREVDWNHSYTSLPGLGEPPTGTTTSATVSRSDTGITRLLALDLITLFFDKVQPWLPLLHRPGFQAHYGSKLADGDGMIGLSVDECLLCYSIFAMSARFSSHHQFTTTAPNKRGHDFAQRARDIFTSTYLHRSPSLTYLQGCILLTFYFYTSGSVIQGWILVGACLRMAYDLGLSEVDSDASISIIDFVEKEEMRRAWWLVWELDTFASAVSRRPYAIDRKRMSVKLPISNDAWFSEIQLPSTQLSLQPGQSWKSLYGTANQDERAWFLVANSLLAMIHDRIQQKQGISADEKLTLENEVYCFRLTLPPSFELNTLCFTSSTFTKCNWIIGTHLLLTATLFMIAGTVTTETDDRIVKSHRVSALRQRAIDLSRILSLWDLRYIPLAHPFLTCMMLPPCAVDSDVYESQQPLFSSTHDLAKLVLEHFAEKWSLGSDVLGRIRPYRGVLSDLHPPELAKMTERPLRGPFNAKEKQLVKRYAVFFWELRLGASGPAFLQLDCNRQDRDGCSISSDDQSDPGCLEVQQQHVQPQQACATPLDLLGQADVVDYQALVSDRQSFPPLQEYIYDWSSDLASDFWPW